jgi:hypothetical protein
MTYRFRTGSWLAGFAAGEGTFYVSPQGNPYFQICLRADDRAVLDALCAEFGGNVRLRAARASKPSATWSVQTRADLPRLVEYFDAHPLRAKKGRDYAVWREAVVAYCEGGGRAALPYREPLSAVRQYDGPVLPFVQRPTGRPRKEVA